MMVSAKRANTVVQEGASEEFSYVVRGAMLRCGCGSFPNMLNLPTCHGMYIKGQPLMNVADSKAGDNISTFGVCVARDKPCEPEVNMEWVNGKPDLLVEGKPALLSCSYVNCIHHENGIIYVEDDGQK
ncbi:DUF4280 domain-containing protein [Paenibacillus massiliensis]|uniref:DUF4280 domain-containing protein n=1 Tax=Paenibacillus massiliensis TaxID=225917 RepID=UPI00042999F3|nr:DUF4280 domain-containing protein [Paenibacillus massiliensis]